MVRVDGVQPAVDFCRNGHGAAGRGQVDDFRAVALACRRCAVGAALVGVLAQHGAAYAVFGIQGLVGEERPCSRRAAVSKLEIQLEYSTAIAADVGYRFFERFNQG